MSKNQLTGRGFRVDTELKLGSAAEMILEKTETNKLDLIVLGAKGLRSTVSILLGGVAQQVLEYATCPVLVVRAPYQGFQKILLVTDGSPSSLSAARYFGKFPLPARLDVRVMHLLPPIEVPIMMEPQFGAWHTIYVFVADPGGRSSHQEAGCENWRGASQADLEPASATWN